MYTQEIIRRADPAHRTLGRIFQEAIATPLGIDFYIGLPPGIHDHRIATVRPLSPWRGLFALRYTPVAVTMKMIRPGSMLRRSFAGLVADPNDRGPSRSKFPLETGRNCAADCACVFGVRPGQRARDHARDLRADNGRSSANPIDEVLVVPSYFSLGFLRPGPNGSFGASQRAFGAPGAGGSFAFADPDMQLGYAYVMNKLDFYLMDDRPRSSARCDLPCDSYKTGG